MVVSEFGPRTSSQAKLGLRNARTTEDCDIMAHTAMWVQSAVAHLNRLLLLALNQHVTFGDALAHGFYMCTVLHRAFVVQQFGVCREGSSHA